VIPANQVPAALADGDWPIQASIGGAQSASGVVLSVKHQRWNTLLYLHSRI
jgi:hypothetical protein